MSMYELALVLGMEADAEELAMQELAAQIGA